jgi:hypothetical protein
MYGGINLIVYSFPSLETFSLELFRLAALLHGSNVPEEVRIDLAWSCSGTGAATTRNS